LRAPRVAVLAAFCLLVASCANSERSESSSETTREAAPTPSAAATPSVAPAAKPAPSVPNEQQTRERMAEIFAAMRFLLPLSLDEQAFEDPTQKQGILDALALLDRSAASLAQHGGSREVPYAHLSRSLAIDARDIHERYEQGHLREARYLVQTLTETCVACHSRLPASSDAPRSAAFMDDAQVEQLPEEQRAKVAYATRQFDDALSLYENVLADADYPASGLEGNLLRALVVGVSVGLSSIAEVQIDGGFHNRLDITRRSPEPCSIPRPRPARFLEAGPWAVNARGHDGP
jgi:hypothetical protein